MQGQVDGIDRPSHGFAETRTTRPSSMEDLVVRIYRQVGAACDFDPEAEPIPIREAIDPEALAAVFNEDSGAAYVSFPVCDRRVTVHSDGEVIVHPGD